MRSAPIAVAAALSLAGCATLPALRAADPAQAVAGDPLAAVAERDGVWLRARPDDWRGWPQELPEYLTAVEVLVENRTGQPLTVGPQDFTLELADGRRLAPLPSAQARFVLRPVALLQPIGPATLAEGQRGAFLLVFPVAANRLERLVVELRPGGAETAAGPGVRLAFARRR
jgi:hypothetical protein